MSTPSAPSATAPFADRVAIVTGGTQGLGEAVAHMFAARGARAVVLCGRNRAGGERVAAAVSAAHPPCEGRFVQADLARVEDCRAVVAAADAAFGQVHCLVNCAAVTDRGSLLDTSPELFDRMFAVNTRAPFFMMQDTAKIMRREGIEGAMVNIISVASHGGQPFLAAYSAAKGALVTLTKNAAFALLPDRIRVNGLNLGWMDTPGEDRVQKEYHGAAPQWREQAAAAQPFGRLLQPREVARAVGFLCADESGMMTGTVVDFDQSVNGCYDAPPHPDARLEG